MNDVSVRGAVESQGPLAIVWVSLGLGAFYIALIWVNTLLGVFLTPLFLIPGTWLLDKMGVGSRPPATDDAAGSTESH
jgi:predicted Na+-dependent transporter